MLTQRLSSFRGPLPRSKSRSLAKALPCRSRRGFTSPQTLAGDGRASREGDRAGRGGDVQHPHLSGVCQVVNAPNFDKERHAWSARLQMRAGGVVRVADKDVLALGGGGSVPAGLGVVEGGEIPYKPEAK